MLDPSLNDSYEIENISKQSLDLDFERNQKIHQCWILRHKDVSVMAGLENMDLFATSN